MFSHKSTYLLALLTLCITGCSIKAYDGLKLPDDQVATVTLKTPAAAYVPLLWVFPLNMLTWFADDWRETAWTDDITIDTNNVDLTDRETRIAEDWLPRYW
ncbi:MAG: hypothetical protein IPN42_08895 [Methylococcaceae bacterium]|nr:hypothetical protein [Methylococcaceae bacterium]